MSRREKLSTWKKEQIGKRRKYSVISVTKPRLTRSLAWEQGASISRSTQTEQHNWSIHAPIKSYNRRSHPCPKLYPMVSNLKNEATTKGNQHKPIPQTIRVHLKPVHMPATKAINNQLQKYKLNELTKTTCNKSEQITGALARPIRSSTSHRMSPTEFILSST